MFWGRRKIKLIFFDVGGVLVDADLERYVQICCAKLRTTPEPLQREVSSRVPLLECGKLESAEFWREVGEALWRSGEGSLADENAFFNLWRDLMSSSLSINSEVVRLAKLLEDSGKRVGILSNAIEEHAAFLEGRGVYAPFNPCIISCRVGMRKPEADIYRLAAKTGGVKPSECLLIDDIPENIEAAKEVGMEGIVFQDALQLAQELVKRELLSVNRSG